MSSWDPRVLTENVSSDTSQSMYLRGFGLVCTWGCWALVACGGPEGPAEEWGPGNEPSSSVNPANGGPVGPGASVPGPGPTGAAPSVSPSRPGAPSANPVAPTSTTPGGPEGSGGSPNLFAELLGKSPSEVDDKVRTAVHRFFGIGTGEPNTPTRDTGYRCYYELTNQSSMAFIWAADSNDIRSEGQSYGMMVAVQMDMQPEFDKLWRFAKAKMQYPGNTPHSAWKYYFKWQGVSAGNDWNFGDTTVPAPDGDEYFAAALYLADQRWGSSGEFDYKQDADDIAAALIHNSPTPDGRFPIFHRTQRMVVFVPYGNSNEITDPSYHLPAFYEMFALYGPSNDRNAWTNFAEVSRDFLVKSAHSSTGLHPDYATFGGAPTTNSPGDGHDRFRYDAWRVVMNMAMDYAWFSQDPRMKAQVEKYHAFFSNYLGQNNVTQSLFHVDGSGAEGGSSTALTATLAAGAMASTADNRATYVENLWNVPQQQGEYRYYQQSVYLLGLLNVAGKYHYAW